VVWSGERSEGSATIGVYTAEQQARLGVDEFGQPAVEVVPAATLAPRQLNGIINSMPGPGAAAPRDYVILGAHDTWSSAPVKLQLASGEEHAVVKEPCDYMVRGLTLADGSVGATVMCEDGTSIACMVAVESVC
jgi:hypothetical protein